MYWEYHGILDDYYRIYSKFVYDDSLTDLGPCHTIANPRVCHPTKYYFTSQLVPFALIHSDCTEHGTSMLCQVHYRMQSQSSAIEFDPTPL